MAQASDKRSNKAVENTTVTQATDKTTAVKNSSTKSGSNENVPDAKISKKESTGKFTPKRIAAIIGMVSLVSLYIITLLVSIFDTTGSSKWLAICIGATFAIPFILWIYIWIYGQLSGKKTITDINYNIGQNKTEEENEEK